MYDGLCVVFLILYPFALAVINSEKIERLRNRIEKLEKQSTNNGI